MATMQNIFHKVKDYILNNPKCLFRLFPQGKQKGAEFYFDAPSYNSWSYNIHKGVVKDFRDSTEQNSGSIIDTYTQIYHCYNILTAAQEMAAQLGIHDDKTTYRKKTKKAYSKVVDIDDAVIKLARTIWEQSLPLGDTVAERYLRKRNINLPCSATRRGRTLRFHPSLYHSDTKDRHPAMIASIYYDNALKAIHRTYLKPDGTKLFPPDSPHPTKKLLGSNRGLAVQLTTGYDLKKTREIGVCEGIESGLSIAEKINIPMWCTLGANNMPNLILPPLDIVQTITIYPDYEQSLVGFNAAMDLKENCLAQGYKSRVYMPPDWRYKKTQAFV